jgi:hypothetical protein
MSPEIKPPIDNGIAPQTARNRIGHIGFVDAQLHQGCKIFRAWGEKSPTTSENVL